MVEQIRAAILQALPSDWSTHGASPTMGSLYIAPAHIKALRLECSLVVGARGVGKSFWTAVLGSPELRSLLGQSIHELEQVDVHTGYGVAASADYPDASTFQSLLGLGHCALDIWKSVVLRWLAPSDDPQLPRSSWSDTVAWLKGHPEEVARQMLQANERLQSRGRRGLVVFDALDRVSDDWQVMDEAVRDLMRVALWLKSYPRLHVKVFLREDQFNRSLANFPDASKLLTTQIDLTWEQHELHGLLWQQLVNAPGAHGECMRQIFKNHVPSPLARTSQGSWMLPDSAQRDTPEQRALFEALAGPWMGRDKRRGVPYVWTVSHLADGRGQTSPRSFLAAIRQAAEDSAKKYPEHPLALHHESIKRGIQAASQIRVDEMAEDHPWVRKILKPLGGLNVPCEYESIVARWRAEFPSGPQNIEYVGLPPRHLEQGWNGIRDSLMRLGIFEFKKDGRIDMPDLYRVGFGLGRKGGVKPKASP